MRWQTTKGEKERFVPLLAEVMKAITDQATQLKRTPFDQLWAMTDWALLKRVKRIAERAGVEDHAELRVHDLRRTFGTRCARAGMPLPQLSKIMGHSSTAITSQYYVHVDRKDNAAADCGAGIGGPIGVPTKTATA